MRIQLLSVKPIIKEIFKKKNNSILSAVPFTVETSYLSFLNVIYVTWHGLIFIVSELMSSLTYVFICDIYLIQSV